MSDADGLKALNDRFGYEAGNELLRAKRMRFARLALRLTTIKATSFSRGQDPEQLQTKLEHARNICGTGSSKQQWPMAVCAALREPISAMDTEKTSPKQKPDSNNKSEREARGNAPEESFGELLKLDPKKVKSIKVLKKKP